MINLTRHTINEKISLGSLVNMEVIPTTEWVYRTTQKKALVKNTLYAIQNCLKITIVTGT